jgi:hypothetical protein
MAAYLYVYCSYADKLKLYLAVRPTMMKEPWLLFNYTSTSSNSDRPKICLVVCLLDSESEAWNYLES